LLSRTGICRRCQLRLGQRRSRARRSPWCCAATLVACAARSISAFRWG